MKKIVNIAFVFSALFVSNVFADPSQYGFTGKAISELQQQVVGIGIVLEKVDSIFLIKDVVNGGPVLFQGSRV